MFDIFVAVLCLYYIGNYDAVDLTLVCTEVFKQIQHLRQFFKYKHCQSVQNSPDECFRQYMSLIPDLPDDTTGWKMQLGHALFAALDKDIRDRLADRLYNIPILSGLPTK